MPHTREFAGCIATRRGSAWRVSAACVLAVACIGPAAAPAHADILERRGAEPALTGHVASVGENGVTVRTESGALHTVAWDRVRRVELDRSDPALERELARFAGDSQLLWRARTRLERSDPALAEPLFERLFEQYRGRRSDTALLVAEGLLRCRLARGANESAVIPALETVRLRRAGNATHGDRTLPPLVDPATSLVTMLPPTWVITASLRDLERDLASYDAHGDTVVAAHAVLYRRAARRHLGMSELADERSLASGDPGVELLRGLVDLCSENPLAREQAQQRIAAQSASLPEWAAAWSSALMGASLLGETGAGRRERGMVHLANVAARHAATLPYLTGLSLARLAEACDANGQPAAAASLRASLAAAFPRHPARTPGAAVTYPALQTAKTSATSATQPASSPDDAPAANPAPASATPSEAMPADIPLRNPAATRPALPAPPLPQDPHSS